MKRTISQLKNLSYDELIEKIDNQNNAIDHITKLLVNQQIITKQLLETIDKQDKIIQKHSNDINSLLFYQGLFVSLNDQQNQIIIYDQLVNDKFKSYTVDKIDKLITQINLITTNLNKKL